MLDLKDAFFCLRLHPNSQPLFAFEWRDPEGEHTGQLTWTRLPQGFKNSPTLFDEALHRDLAPFRAQNPQISLLQYVDDLLLAANTKEACEQGTGRLLKELGELGYRVSAKNAQLCRTEVIYLGYIMKDSKRWLTEARKKTVITIPVPTTPRQVREFLGMAGFCRLWIPGFATLAAPLYPLTRDQTPFVWTPEHQRVFEGIKNCPAHGPSSSSSRFDQAVHSIRGRACRAGSGSADTDSGTMEKTCSLPIEEIGPCGKLVAIVSEGNSCSSSPSEGR